MDSSATDLRHMRQALQLAARGQGHVEPNPMVGCVIARGDQVLAEGWHQQFGGPHAEVNALQAAGETARGAALYVTLEPCCHDGKTPPCVQAILQAQIARVVIALEDPFSRVAGQGIRQLREASVQVDVGLNQVACQQLNAPYIKRLLHDRPWVICKWAMTLDGKIASHNGDSQWISSAAARRIVHQLRGRVDAILVGSRTAQVDNPLLTARPAGPRTAARVVVDSAASLPIDSQLVDTATEAPVLVAVSPDADSERCHQLKERGCEVLICSGEQHLDRLDSLLNQLSQRGVTNLLVEGGGQTFGNLLQLDQIDEVHAFIAPKLLGGASATSAIQGVGFASINQALVLDERQVQSIDGDMYVSGRVRRSGARENESL